jgi:hypothetical protein
MYDTCRKFLKHIFYTLAAWLLHPGGSSEDREIVVGAYQVIHIRAAAVFFHAFSTFYFEYCLKCRNFADGSGLQHHCFI